MLKIGPKAAPLWYWTILASRLICEAASVRLLKKVNKDLTPIDELEKELQ